jgi:hypothetical protein
MASTTISQVFTFILIGGLFAAIFTQNRNAISVLASVTVIVGILFSEYLEKILDVPVSSRYGMPIAIIGLIIVPTAIESKIGKIIMLSLSGTTYIFMLWATPFMT